MITRKDILLFVPLLLGISFIVLSVVGYFLADDPPPPPPEPVRVEYPVVTELAADADIDQRFASLSYGVNTFLWWDENYRTWDLENMRLMNFAYAKQSFSWRNIQPNEGIWKWHIADEVIAEALYRGRRVVARIDGPPDWVLVQNPADITESPFNLDALEAYCGTLAARYAGQIEAYQIWNEPNLAREWGEQQPNAESYVRLLAVCSDAIRAVDPDVTIISAGLSPTGTDSPEALPDERYLWQMYEAGAAAYFDVLGLHAPGYKLPPEASVQDALEAEQNTWARFRHVETMRAIMVANGDAHKQIAILEMGWTTDSRPDSDYEWFGVSQETQAEYLARAYAYAAEHWRPWVGLMVTIYMSDFAWTQDDEQWWWSMDEPAPYPTMKVMRPAYYALANMEKISDNPEFSEPERQEGVPVIIEPLPPRN